MDLSVSIVGKGHKKAECKVFLNKRNEKESGRKNLLVSGRANNGSLFENDILGMYKGFLSDGIVTVGGQEHSVVVLRDTGAAQSIWVADSGALSPSSSLNMCALIQGVNSDVGQFKAVPLHQVHLQSSLVTGVVEVGVVAGLPIPGVMFVLGNDLAGERVSVIPLVSEVPMESPETQA